MSSSSPNNSNRRIPADSLRRFASRCLQKMGTPPDRGDAVADILVEGDLMGHTTHGTACLAPYLRELENGAYQATGEPDVLNDHGSAVTLDGKYILGPWLVCHAMELAFDRIADHPLVTVVIRRSGHIGNLSSYLLKATDRNLVCLLMSSDPSVRKVAPHGSMRPLYTPNPIAAGIPTEGRPVILDITMSTTSVGKITRLSQSKGEFAEPWVIDGEGNPSRDPAVCFADPPGAILPLGGTDLGYKGFALGFIVEVLTSGLGGFGRSDGADQWGASVFLQIIDPEAFAGLDALTKETSWFASSSRSSPKASEGSPVRMPGDRAFELREEQLRNGVLLHPAIPPAFEEWSEKLGVPLP